MSHHFMNNIVLRIVKRIFVMTDVLSAAENLESEQVQKSMLFEKLCDRNHADSSLELGSR
jgi:hypothetical protein